MQDDAVAVVEAWQSAGNQRDVAAALALSAPDVAISGPRGNVKGHAILADWIERAGISLTTVAVYACDGRVVLSQDAVWTADEASDPHRVASSFVVLEQQVSRLARFDSLAGALHDAGLTEADALSNA